MNTKAYMAFDRKWFDRYQEKLIFLLNFSLTRRFFRGVLKITKEDVGYEGTISKIAPNFYDVFLGYDKNGAVKFIREFRTHDKYSKRLYYSFKPLWWAIHYWDELFADRYAPSLSFGFRDLIFYPDASVAIKAVDGVAYRFVAEETWTALRNGAGGGTNSAAATDGVFKLQCGTTTNLFTFLVRSFYAFYTGDQLNVRDAISAVTLSIYLQSKPGGSFMTTGQRASNVIQANLLNNNSLVNGDYERTTDFTRLVTGDKADASFLTGQYNDYAFNATGLATVSKGINAVSKYSVRFASDIDDSIPNWTSGGFDDWTGYYADETGSTKDPKLTVTVTSNAYILPRNVGRPRPFAPGLAK